MKPALIITDSLGLPRLATNLNYEDTWLYQLAQAYPHIWQLSGGGITITGALERLTGEAGYLHKGFFGIGVVQLGIVDCAPRPIPQAVRKKVDKLPLPFKTLAIKGLHHLRPFIQARFGYWQFTPYEVYQMEYHRLLEQVSHLCVKGIVLEIAPVLPCVERQSPGISKQIDRYNELVRSEVARFSNLTLITLGDFPAMCLTDDVHITRAGHERLWERIRPHISCLTIPA